MPVNGKWLKWMLFGGVIIVLMGVLVFFSNYFSQNAGNRTETPKTAKKESKNVEVTAKGEGAYKTVIKNGRYVTSKSRGITAAQNANQMNMVSFQSGLLNFSKDQFSTSKYVFQEGQYLDAATAEKWLNRESKDNPEGLNPKDNGKTDDKRVPNYLQTIEEQNFMTQKGNDLQLDGIVIGLAMNTQDVYEKEKYGAKFTQDISDADRKREGERIAKEVVARYRKLEGVNKDTKIVVVLYAQNKNDALSGGNFYSWTQSSTGDSVSEFKNLDNKTVVLPMQPALSSSEETPLGTELNESFKNFTDLIEKFFPNLSTVTGQAQYTDGNLQGLNVNITTQFYSATEIENFANYIAQNAPSYLPKGVPVQIRMNAATGMQAYIMKDADSDKYTVNILGSY
ncbi:Sex pheromone biosynthesis protein [Weissella tructae]|uniref:Sex pheromone biosynthesis protein n=1 Tax=Weissella tructae TaxID=887702 RepID=A0ABN4DH61_9LACO|nr:CamS family sex pheromone protein [Weissella tructae]AIG65537.1 Sex pheromone biosynthesis protein [Weissella tructae]